MWALMEAGIAEWAVCMMGEVKQLRLEVDWGSEW